MELADDDPPLLAFTTWYHARVTELISGIRDSCGACVVSHTRPLRSEAGAVIDPGYTRGSDAVLCHYVGGQTALLERLIEVVRGSLGDGQRLEVQLPVSPPESDDGQTLVRDLTRAAELGVASVNLDHYGRLPRERIDLVKQAIRFARRTAR